MSGDFIVRDNTFGGSNVNIGRTITAFQLPQTGDGSQSLREELRLLRAELSRRAGPDSSAAAAVAVAEEAVVKRDTAGTKAALVQAGKFALECAKDIGTHLAEAALEAALHMSG